jgi:hypothetical protein
MTTNYEPLETQKALPVPLEAIKARGKDSQNPLSVTPSPRLLAAN